MCAVIDVQYICTVIVFDSRRIRCYQIDITVQADCDTIGARMKSLCRSSASADTSSVKMYDCVAVDCQVFVSCDRIVIPTNHSLHVNIDALNDGFFIQGKMWEFITRIEPVIGDDVSNGWR